MNNTNKNRTKQNSYISSLHFTVLFSMEFLAVYTLHVLFGRSYTETKTQTNWKKWAKLIKEKNHNNF